MKVAIEATVPVIRPPLWAQLERSLIDRMSAAVAPVMARYVRGDGSVMWPTRDDFTGIDGLDDAYESFHNWPVLYALGGADELAELAQGEWEAVTRQFARYDVEAWMERTVANGGILPDNVGLSGRIGEYLDGKWYGGYYGWTWPHGWHHLSDACISAAQNATLLTGDRGYMEFPQTQMRVLAGEARQDGVGTWQVPYFHHDGGWDGYTPMQARHTAHIWGVTMAAADRDLGVVLRDHGRRDFERVIPSFSKHGGNHEAPWPAFLAGEYADYPVDILRHDHGQVYQRLAFMQDDTQDPATYGDWYLQVRNPVFVEGLVQLTTGAPLPNYDGGLQLARLRWFDGQRRRPGLPRGDPDPRLTDVQYAAVVDRESAWRTQAVGATGLTVLLPPSTRVRMTLRMDRFAAASTYAPPW